MALIIQLRMIQLYQRNKVGLVTACDKSSGSTVNEGTTITITVGAKSDAAQN